MILVIQCAGSKRSDAGPLVSPAGKPVLVVANPETAPADDAFVHARPDDLSDNGGGAFRGQKGAGPTAALAFLASVAI